MRLDRVLVRRRRRGGRPAAPSGPAPSAARRAAASARASGRAPAPRFCVGISARRPGEAVAGDRPGGHQLPEGLLDLGAQPAHARGDVLEEAGAARARRNAEHVRAPAAERARRRRRPRAGASSQRQIARAGPAPIGARPRLGARRAAAGAPSSRPQTTSPARQSSSSQPGRSRPRARAASRCSHAPAAASKPCELLDHRAGARRARAAASPGATCCQASRKRMQSAAADRLDLAAQPVERAAVDAREQPPIAPLHGLRVGRPRREAPAQDAALQLHRAPARRRRRRRAAPRRAASGRGRGRADQREPGAHQLDSAPPRSVQAAARRAAARPVGLEARGGPGRRRPASAARPRPRRRGRRSRRRAARRVGDQRVEHSRLPAARGSRASGSAPRSSRRSCSSSASRTIGPRPPPPPRRSPAGSRPPSARPPAGSPRRTRDRAGAPLLERRVVEEGVGVGVEDLVAKTATAPACSRATRRMRPACDRVEHGAQAVRVHRLDQAVAHGLAHQRVVGDLDGAAAVVVLAGGLGREHRREQVLGAHALEGGRHALAALRSAAAPARGIAFQRQRVSNIGACSAAWIRSSSDAVGAEHLEHRLQREAVLRPQREQDAVVGGRRLQLEVEACGRSACAAPCPRRG